MSNNDEEEVDDEHQQQSITDEMEQKRLEEAAASVEWVFSCYYTYDISMWNEGLAPHTLSCEYCVFYFSSCVSPKIFTNSVCCIVSYDVYIQIKQTNKNRYRRARKAAIAAMEAEAAAE